MHFFSLSRIAFNAVSASSLALLWMVCLNGSIWAQTSSNGCTNPYACNYDAEAAEDDGSCEFESCQWCPDPEACNYEGEGFPWTANPFLCHYIEGDECDCEGNVPDALGECGGSCASDADGDGLCDDVDPCVGSLDNCGICNGPGAVYDCGCTPIPEGDCDCEGTQVDAIGVCGGSCLEDADSDGVCDDVDPCVGQIDACGLCNGPGAIFECGCTVLLIGTCDCDGNMLDAIGVCGGDCLIDWDGDGFCDSGCTDAAACNYDASNVVDDGSCTYPDPPYGCDGLCVNDSDGDGVCDELEIYGCTNPLAVNSVGGDYCFGWDEESVYNPLATEDNGMCLFPYACGGQTWDNCSVSYGPCEGDANDNGICDNFEVFGCTDPMACNYDSQAICNPSLGDEMGGGFGDGGLCDYESCSGCLEPDACNYDPNATVDFGWYDCEYFSCSGCTDIDACNYDPEAGNDNGSCEYPSFPLDCAGNCVNDSDGDGVCDELEIFGCTDSLACNYAVEATEEDGSCLYNDVLGECGGNCVSDADDDGICDDVDDCVGEFDACGVCNGPGSIYECGCTAIPAGDCDCEGNQLDALGVCGGNCGSDEDADGVCDDAEISGCTFQWACNYAPMATENDGSCLEVCEGCTDAFACNYDSNANEDDGSCFYTEPGFDCAGNCWDLDGDGACDDPLTNLVEGPIVVELDTVFGDGELAGYRSYLVHLEFENETDVLSAIFSDTLVYDWAELLQIDAPEGCWNPLSTSMVMSSDNSSIFWQIVPLNQYDTFWTIGMLSGDSSGQLPSSLFNPMEDGESICDVDVANGSIYTLGMPSNAIAGGDHRVTIARVTTPGNFTISGNAQVFLEGSNSNEFLFPFHTHVNAEQPGCPDPEACNYNEFGYINWSGCIYPNGVAACDGTCPDGLDEDGDGICDDVDTCFGVEDECGVCNGPGAIYECGCNDLGENECDCFGSELDALGVCGGDCLADINGDGECDCELYVEDEPILIPDDQTSCLSLSMTVDGMDEASDVTGLFINMEHSYLGDLRVTYICPNGQSVQVQDQSGFSTFLGEPVDSDDTPNLPGVGYDYAWIPEASNGTWTENASGGTVPSGTYESFEPISNLQGCPVNGVWTLEICDLWGADNGFVFNWGIQLDSENVYASAPVSSCPVGCTNAEACNFDPEAVVDDGSCFTFFDLGLGDIAVTPRCSLNDTVHFDAMDYPNGEPLLGVWYEAQNNGSFSGSNGGFEVNWWPEEFGFYNLCFADSLCGYTICYTVEVNEVPVVEIVSDGVPVQGEEIWVCGPEVLELEAVVNASAGSTSISWPSLGIFNESSVLVDADEFAQLTVVASAENNCGVSQSSLELVTLPEPVMNNETILCDGDGVLLDPIVGDDNSGWAFQWTFNGNALPFTSTGLLVEEEGSYCVTVPGSGCPASYDDSDCAFVEVEDCPDPGCVELPVQVPDEPGNCLTLELDSIPFVSEGAVTGLYVNMEHSYMGDLSISLICPNGQTLTLHSSGGGGAFLGEPLDDDSEPDVPGTGYLYEWSSSATNGTWEQNAGGGTLPSGVYQSLEPFANLDGCPAQGNWQLEVCDLLALDNGFIFDWGIEFEGSEIVSFEDVGACQEGCMDSEACNYNAFADEDDGSCLYPGDTCDDNDDTTINDMYSDDCVCAGEVDGLTEAESTLDWSVYPSPTFGVLNLRLEGAAWGGEVEAVISSATGQALRLERLAGQTQLDVHELAPGVYFLTLRSPAMAATTRRFVVGGE